MTILLIRTIDRKKVWNYMIFLHRNKRVQIWFNPMIHCQHTILGAVHKRRWQLRGIKNSSKFGNKQVWKIASMGWEGCQKLQKKFRRLFWMGPNTENFTSFTSRISLYLILCSTKTPHAEKSKLILTPSFAPGFSLKFEP